MTRLVIATVILAVALVVTKRKLRRRPGVDSLRVTSRTTISRGVMAAVLETEDRRFLVTISGTSTTVVAELGATGATPTATPTPDATDFPAALAARLPDAAVLPTPAARPTATPAAAAPVAPVAAPVAAAPVRPVPAPTAERPTLRVPSFMEADAAVARGSLPRRPAGQPSVIAAAGDDDAATRRSLLDRARARTVRNYDVAELTSTKPGA